MQLKVHGSSVNSKRKKKRTIAWTFTYLLSKGMKVHVLIIVQISSCLKSSATVHEVAYFVYENKILKVNCQPKINTR